MVEITISRQSVGQSGSLHVFLAHAIAAFVLLEAHGNVHVFRLSTTCIHDDM